MISAFSWQKSISLCPASFRIPRPNLPVTPGVSWLPTFAFQSPKKTNGEGNGNPLQYSCLENPMDGGAWWAAVHGVTRRQTQLSDFTLFFHFHALEKEMATHSSVLAWRIPGTGEPGGLELMKYGLIISESSLTFPIFQIMLLHWVSHNIQNTTVVSVQSSPSVSHQLCSWQLAHASWHVRKLKLLIFFY